MKKYLINCICILVIILSILSACYYKTSEITKEDTYIKLVEQYKDLSDTDYIIITDYDNHLTNIYDKSNNLIISSPSVCSDKYTSKGMFYIINHRKEHRLGTKINGEHKFQYWFVTDYSKDKNSKGGLSIHTVLYELNTDYDNRVLYHDLINKKQDINDLYANNWSGGCTRTNDELAKFVYNHCSKGTVYLII